MFLQVFIRSKNQLHLDICLKTKKNQYFDYFFIHKNENQLHHGQT